MPKRKAPQEFEVQIEKDPKNPDAYKTAEWTVNKRHPYWESLFWCRKQIVKRRKISPVGSSDQEVQILESPPKQTQHQKLKQSNKTPPEIGTRKNLIDQQPLTQNQQQRYPNQNQPYESIYPILKGSLLNIINPEPEEPEITFHQPQFTQIELDSHSENY